MNTLFQGFINAIKARMIPIWTKIKLYTSPSYVRGEILRRLIQYFRKMTDVKPRHKNDYYGFFAWLVSKRLAFLIVVIIGMSSAFYVTVVQPLSVFTASGNGVKTYSYRSIPLRFTDGKVRILAKSKYVAYEGQVSKGAANGSGVLSRPDGSTVYEGQFMNNEFHGTGTSYYKTGQTEYVGGFQHNVFSGTGKLYRENGSVEYDGSFLEGKKDGEGVLYDSGSNKVFTGNFSKGHLQYADFLGKSTAQAAGIYTGKKTVYTDDEYFVVDMEDIHGVYYGKLSEENLADKVMIEGVYVLSNTFAYGEKVYDNIEEITQVLQEQVYEGNTYLKTPDAVSVHVMNKTEPALHGDITGKWEKYLSDAIKVNGYDKEYSAYIYTFVQEDMRYTFFCKDRSGTFSMYMIEKQQ